MRKRHIALKRIHSTYTELIRIAMHADKWTEICVVLVMVFVLHQQIEWDTFCVSYGRYQAGVILKITVVKCNKSKSTKMLFFGIFCQLFLIHIHYLVSIISMVNIHTMLHIFEPRVCAISKTNLMYVPFAYERVIFLYSYFTAIWFISVKLSCGFMLLRTT